jgi:hypothetical protein
MEGVDRVLIPPTTYMADKGPLWAEIVRNDGLQPIAYEQLVSWSFGDFILNSGFDNISSTIKARRGGLRSVSIPKRCLSVSSTNFAETRSFLD